MLGRLEIILDVWNMGRLGKAWEGWIWNMWDWFEHLGFVVPDLDIISIYNLYQHLQRGHLAGSPYTTIRHLQPGHPFEGPGR